MKSRILICLTAITLFAALAARVRLAAQVQNQDLPRYTVIDLGTFGGTYSEGDGISDSGWVLGDSTLPDGYGHAYLWRSGVMTDLGTLGGPDSWSGENTNIWGDGVGEAETTTPDPLNENWCGADDKCLPFLWRSDLKKMIALPLLGGNNGIAWGVNDFRQVAGEAETAATDPTCPPNLQVMPVLWQNGEVQALPLFPGDPDGGATIINDFGQAVGDSGNCSGTILHAMLWENGKAIYLGTVGGTFSNAIHINNLGQVVGYSGLPGNPFWHAFLWQKGVMTDLGTLSGDFTSEAFSINLEGQVVGWSGNSCGCQTRAFLWQKGAMTDLNALISPESPLYLTFAVSINDEGQIAGIGTTSTGESHAFLATPSNGGPESETATMATSTEHPNFSLSDNVQKMLRRRARIAGSTPSAECKGGLVTPR